MKNSAKWLTYGEGGEIVSYVPLRDVLMTTRVGKVECRITMECGHSQMTRFSSTTRARCYACRPMTALGFLLWFIDKHSVFNHDTGCRLWTLPLVSGYGWIRSPVYVGGAHRASYLISVVAIPPGLQLDHLCRVRSCVNHKHLEAVTQQENIARGIVGENMRIKTHCPSGHEYNAKNTYVDKTGGRCCRSCKRNWAMAHRDPSCLPRVRLSDDAVRAIRSAVANGELYWMIAPRFGVSVGAVGKIIRGENYRMVR